MHEEKVSTESDKETGRGGGMGGGGDGGEGRRFPQFCSYLFQNNNWFL